jgi:UPF0755 protein
MAKIVIATLLALAAAAAVGISVLYPSRAGPGPGREVELEILGDESAYGLAARLASAGLVSSPRLFSIYWRLRGAVAAKGTHLFTDDLPPRELAARLERRGAAARIRITIPEGWTTFDIARRLHEKRICTEKTFLNAARSRALLDGLGIQGESAEGFLFPATYDLSADSDPAEVVRRLKTEFDKRWLALEPRHASGELDLVQSLGWSSREIIILASMIEKEAAVDEERPIIASVFLNRLRDPSFKKKFLQCDPTAGYGCLLHPELATCTGYAGKITHDINVDPDNPYSTYTHEKLPPGPISNPGTKSIEAVLAPATTRYLFFVARGEGRHAFSETYEAHAAAVHR